MQRFFTLLFGVIFSFMFGLHILASHKVAMSEDAALHPNPADQDAVANEAAVIPVADALQEGEYAGDPAMDELDAIAAINGTQEGSTISGQVVFTQTPAGLKVEADVFNVPNPGEHGFHIHEKGSCGNAGADAGGHYNPHGVAHGLLLKDGHAAAHAGDMGNIVIDETGHGVYEGFLPFASLKGEKYNVAGLAVIVHEKMDDFGQPTGNAGGRIGCGIITLSE